MKPLLLATNNPGKVKEMRALLAALPAPLVLPADLGLKLDVVENGSTYAENAALKAGAFSQASGMITLADDSGLEVDTLDGLPGLHSHRLLPNPDASDADRRKRLLELLSGKPFPWRAHFHCTVAIVVPADKIEYAEGNCPGEIIPRERGSNGFGYDPIFLLAGMDKTMAELTMNEKNRLSHRALAVQAAIPLLKQLLAD
ncbi:MAG TPA: RdgB/HAM1 family non-canonical purine NTP pyrophosphatase [Longilinea sp.]|nr:RdgB/HAM1 family non-canonical purine NTP pyrophosphatase [Longilinea sp.]